MKTLNDALCSPFNQIFTLLIFCFGITLASCSTDKPRPNEADIPTITKAEYEAPLNEMMSAYRSAGFADADKGRKDTLMMMATLLNENNFDAAIKIGNAYISKYELNDDIQYMLATALFQHGEYAKASKHYRDLIKQNGPISTRQAKYYLALCYLRFDGNSQQASALKLLNEIKADPGEEFNPQDIQGLIDLFS